jgi:RNA polymerase sigma-70 factor, ECF subfamily
MKPFDRLRALPAETIAAAGNGDADAVNEVVEESYDAVRHMLLRLVGRAPELDDLQQTVLLHLVRGLRKYRPEAAFSTWLSGVCMNVVRDNFRRQKARRVVQYVPDTDFVGAPEGQAQSADDAERRLDGQARLRQCLTVLHHLSPEQRTVFVLRTVYGYSINEIAAITKSLKSTTRLRLYYGRKAFCRAMAQEAVRLADAAAHEVVR